MITLKRESNLVEFDRLMTFRLLKVMGQMKLSQKSMLKMVNSKILTNRMNIELTI